MPETKVGFAIGNGISRRGFKLDRLTGKGITIGCNGVYRHYSPDYIVGLDVWTDALLDVFYNYGGQKRWKLISRCMDEKCKGWVTVDSKIECAISDINDGWNNNSGLMAAAYLSERLGCTKVYLIGIDFFLPVPGEESNDMLGGNASFATGVVYPFNKLAAKNPQTEFVRVGPIAEHDREFYDRFENYTFIEYVDFPY